MAQACVSLSTEFLKVFISVTRSEVLIAAEPAMPVPTSRGLRLGMACHAWENPESRFRWTLPSSILDEHLQYKVHEDNKWWGLLLCKQFGRCTLG